MSLLNCFLLHVSLDFLLLFQHKWSSVFFLLSHLVTKILCSAYSSRLAFGAFKLLVGQSPCKTLNDEMLLWLSVWS